MAKDKKETDNGIVLYTDGGARDYVGWGYHAYLYPHGQDEPKNLKKEDQPTDVGYVDKENLAKEKATGVKVTKYVDAWGNVNEVNASNNTAELKAAVEGFKLAIDESVKKVTVLSDSKYVLGGATEWYKKWRDNGWLKPDGTDVSNSGLWKELIGYKETLAGNGVEMDWKWVKGHSGNIGNDMADRNATKGVWDGYRQEGAMTVTHKVESKEAGYWNPKSEYNRMLNHPQWYFLTNLENQDDLKTEDGRHIYYCGTCANKNEMIGKRATEHAYSVVFLKEQEPILQTIREAQDRFCDNEYEEIVFASLPAIFNPVNYREIEQHDCDYVVPHRGRENRDLVLFDTLKNGGVQLTTLGRPPKISLRVFEYCRMLESTLLAYLNDTDDSLIATDITSNIYEASEKKGKPVQTLLKSVSQNPQSLDVLANYKTNKEVEQKQITLTMGLDIPNKNALGRLATGETKVTLLTWRESKRGFRFATVVDTGTDVGIWSSVHSNLAIVV